MGRKATERAVVIGFFSWWVFILIAFGLIGNAFLLYKALQAGNAMASIMLGIFFCGACVYLYRTYKAREEIRSLLHD